MYTKNMIVLEKAGFEVIIEKLDSIEKKLMQNTTLADELLTVEQAVRLTKYEKQTIYNLIKKGKLKDYGIGRSRRVNKKELLVYLRKNAR